MRKIPILLLLLMLSFALQAQEAVKRETVERLLQVTDAKAVVDAVYSQVDKMFLDMAQQLGIEESEQAFFNRYMQKVAIATRKAMSWEKIKGPMVDIYLKHYTEKELEDLLAFYNTDSGKAMIKKMPLVMQESMMISQSMLMEFMPKLRELSVEFKEELRLARSAEQKPEGGPD